MCPILILRNTTSSLLVNVVGTLVFPTLGLISFSLLKLVAFQLVCHKAVKQNEILCLKSVCGIQTLATSWDFSAVLAAISAASLP